MTMTRRYSNFTALVTAVAFAFFCVPSVSAQRFDRFAPVADRSAQEHETVGVCGGVTLIAVAERAEQPQARGGGFHISPSYGAGVTPLRQAVIQRAVDEWDAFIETAGVNPTNYHISFSYADIPTAGVLAYAAVYRQISSGDLGWADVTIDSVDTWFEDPTPWDDSEFTPGPGPSGYDLLTVMRHEIGHAVGWIATVRVTNLVSGNTFDPARMNIAIVPGDPAHASSSIHPNDLMNTSIGPGTRRGILLYPHVSFVARAFFYDVPARFVDGAFAGVDGSANNPWPTIAQAFSGTPPGVPIIIVPRTYSESVPITRSTATTLIPARGGDVTITGP